jgi:hypothetical protein
MESPTCLLTFGTNLRHQFMQMNLMDSPAASKLLATAWVSDRVAMDFGFATKATHRQGHARVFSLTMMVLAKGRMRL